jgi:hypothetical protein
MPPEGMGIALCEAMAPDAIGIGVGVGADWSREQPASAPRSPVAAAATREFVHFVFMLSFLFDIG